MEDNRKAKEEEKFRTEKENWILNVLKSVKDFTTEQKMYLFDFKILKYFFRVLYNRSVDIMTILLPSFKN